MSNFTLFTSDPGSQNTGNAFDQDAFQDITLAPTSNSGLTSTALTNPLNFNFSNDDGVRYAAKTLYIKDLVLVQDHALWVSGKPTYEIIWNESHPQIRGYVFGSVQINRGKYVYFRDIGDGIGITGVLRKCAFIVTGDRAGTATGQFAVDGVNTTTASFGNTPLGRQDGNNIGFSDNKYAAFVNSASNATKDVHDYRLTAIEVNDFAVTGVVVYAENSGQNIDVFSGTTYVNKSKVFTSAGATMALPTYAGSLGGRALIYKASNGGYSLAIQNSMNIASAATGSSGTNLMTVTTGTGGSFPIGSGVAAFFGSSAFVGIVSNQSTDTLTVSPTLSFGISGAIYKTWSAGASLAINASLMMPYATIDFNSMNGFSSYFSSASGDYRVWGSAIGMTGLDTIWPALLAQPAGFLQIEGRFSAIDIEFVGAGILHATFGVNGFNAFGINTTLTTPVKRTVFTDAGPGWNSVNLAFGSSQGAAGINRINLYQSQLPPGISNGLLAQLDTLPTAVSPPIPVTNATLMALGSYHRYFGDQLLFQGGWVRAASTTAAGGIQYAGFSTNASLAFQYYGKNFAVLGAGAGQSLTLAFDGGAASGFTLGLMRSVATEGFHTVTLANPSGTSIAIHAIDVQRSTSGIKSLQNFTALPPTSAATKPLSFWSGYFDSTFVWSRNGAYGNATNNTAGSVVHTQNFGFGVVTSAATPSVSFFPASSTAAYLVNVSVPLSAFASAATSGLRLTDAGASFVISSREFRQETSASANVTSPMVLSGIYVPQTTEATTLQLQMIGEGGTAVIRTIGLSQSSPMIEWSMIQIRS